VSVDDVAVRTVGLGKMYRIGGAVQPHATLRDAIVEAAKKPIMRIRHPGAATSSMETLWALKDVDLEVHRGEVLGIIGRNGAGKSTLLKVLSRITEPTEGYLEVEGRVGSLLEVGTGFHPELTGRENIYLSGAILGMPRTEIDRNFEAIVDFSEIGRFLDTPVKRYSSGMYVRLAFAVAAHLEPEVLVIDEVLSVGDAAFQRKCLGRMGDVAHGGRTVLFVSHVMQAVRTLCDRAVQLDEGRIVNDGPAGKVVEEYLRGHLEAESSVAWPAGEQPGDDDVRLVSMAVLDEHGDPASSFLTSQPLTVRMDVDLRRVHDDLVIGFDLMMNDGTMVVRSYQTDGPREIWPTLREGRNRLECVIPAGLLNDGRYLAMPRISIYKVRWIVQIDTGVAFDTERDTTDGVYGLSPRPGAIAPTFRWVAEPLPARV